MLEVSLVASSEKDLGKPVNAKRKKISTISEDLVAPTYRARKEKDMLMVKYLKKSILFIFIFLLLIQAQSNSHMICLSPF